jgi:hypothetical protein
MISILKTVAKKDRYRIRKILVSGEMTEETYEKFLAKLSEEML